MPQGIRYVYVGVLPLDGIKYPLEVCVACFLELGAQGDQLSPDYCLMTLPHNTFTKVIRGVYFEIEGYDIRDPCTTTVSSNRFSFSLHVQAL